jgi:integrase
MPEQLQQQSDAYHNFEIRIRNAQTKSSYVSRMKKFLGYCRVDNYDSLLYDNDTKLIQTRIVDFLIHIQGEMSTKTARYYALTMKFFYEMNDVTTLNWKKINKVIGESTKVANDRPYTTEEISKLLQKVDQRGRIIILLMCSSGMSQGAIHLLKLAHLEKIQDVYKITVYKNSAEEYTTFCSPECVKMIDDYLEYRKRCGEILKPSAPLIRKQFDKNNVEQAANVIPITAGSVRDLIYTAVNDAGIREKKNMIKGQRKVLHEVMQSHGLRKFFNTQVVVAHMSPLYSEFLMGHKQGLAMQSYVKPTTAQLLHEYLKVVDAVTINEENKLRRQVQSLTVRADKVDKLAAKFAELERKLSDN